MRLTYKDKYGHWCSDGSKASLQLGNPRENWPSILWGDAVNKLADYEDAEEQGRLVILPCKVGDTVWRLATGTRGKRRSAHPQYVIYEFRISEVYGSKSMMFFGHNIIDGKISTSYEVFREDDFGKTVFLTREEAEAALKGEQTDV